MIDDSIILVAFTNCKDLSVLINNHRFRVKEILANQDVLVRLTISTGGIVPFSCVSKILQESSDRDIWQTCPTMHNS